MTEAPASRDDFRVQELGNAVLTLRRDLTFSPQTVAGNQGYLIEDPVRSKFYRVGLSEYHFISLLDGTTTVKGALAKVADACGSNALTEQAGASICQWLIDSDLAHTERSRGTARLNQRAERDKVRRQIARLNPIFVRVPLFQPDRIVRVAYRFAGWIYSRIAVVLAMLLFGSAAIAVIGQWDRFVRSTEGIFSPHGYLSLLFCWLLLKIAHEFGHGIVCHKYGGEVRETGVMCILLLPIAYVDVTSSWRFPSKWQRIATALGGMYIELILGSIAALIWSVTPAGPVSQLCTNFVLMATLTTALFNANPLMRFDGYYVLSDLLEIPNLYASGQQYLHYFARRYFLGARVQLPPWPRRQALFIKFYAFAALFWRILICTTLTVAAAAMFHGAGIVLAIMALFAWFARPLVKFSRFLFTVDPTTRSGRRRCVAVIVAISAGLFVLVSLLPWPWTKQAPAVVEYAPLTIVRAGSAGFVRQLHVRGSQIVHKGQVLAELENPQLAADVGELELGIETARLKSITYHNRQEMAAYQSEIERIEGLTKQLAEKRAQIEQLTVYAPVDGKVVSRRLALLKGTYLKEGDELLALGNESAKEIRVSIAQEDIDQFHGALGRVVDIRIPGSEAIRSTLARIEPRASTQPLHPSLCATNGGSLTVKQKDASQENDSDKIVLLDPHFTAIVGLGQSQSQQLFSGQRASIRLITHDESLGQHLWTGARRWLRVNLRNFQ